MGQGTWPVVAAAAFVGFLVGILWLAVLGRIAAGALVVTVHVLAGALLALCVVTYKMPLWKAVRVIRIWLQQAGILGFGWRL